MRVTPSPTWYGPSGDLQRRQHVDADAARAAASPGQCRAVVRSESNASRSTATRASSNQRSSASRPRRRRRVEVAVAARCARRCTGNVWGDVTADMIGAAIHGNGYRAPVRPFDQLRVGRHASAATKRGIPGEKPETDRPAGMDGHDDGPPPPCRWSSGRCVTRPGADRGRPRRRSGGSSPSRRVCSALVVGLRARGAGLGALAPRHGPLERRRPADRTSTGASWTTVVAHRGRRPATCPRRVGSATSVLTECGRARCGPPSRPCWC